jgi:hypothetical protein
MRSGCVEKAGAQALKIGEAITNFNSAELSRVNVLSNSRSMWSKVRQLTGRSKSLSTASQNSAITEVVLNSHCVAVFTDANYTAPSVKATANNSSAATHVTEPRLFKVLDTLRPTATGLHNIPAWFLRIGAPFFTAPLADLMNLLSSLCLSS